MAALDLPDIPGVPLDVIPEFVQAIRTATKFYAKCHGRSFYGEMIVDSNDDEPVDASSAVVLNSLMERMAAATKPIEYPDDDEWSKRRQAMEHAVQRWLDSLKRIAESAGRRTQKREQQVAGVATTDSAQQLVSNSVPYSCFLYIWDLQQSHERIAVRRAGLYLTGLLLQRSKDCRFHLQQEDHLGQWLQATFFSYQPQKAAGDLQFLQIEADFWLNHLVEKGYARLYPKIQVALQRLRQRCPHLESADKREATMPVLCSLA